MTHSELLQEAQHIQPDTVALRRSLHRVPEVGNTLPKTRQIILDAIDGLPLQTHLHTTTSGVVAVLEGAKAGPSIILRGDFDALAMPEDTDLDFASEHEGQMHACGHDLHTAMLVGAARLLSARRDQLAGKVIFMFQPGEEGHHGARFMLDEGMLDVVDPRPEKAFAIHVSTTYAAGTVNFRSGPLMAAADTITITVTGQGGHASAPHHAKDPIPVAAMIIANIELALTRQVNVWDPAVITFGKFAAGTTDNVIPEQALIKGTTRTFSTERRRHVHEMINQVAHGLAAAHGVEVQVTVDAGYPVTFNDADEAARVERLAVDLLGADKVVTDMDPIMGAEDWSYVLQKVPGIMAFLGACPRDLDPATAPANHSNRVVFDEDVMAEGIALHVAVAMDALAGS